ncbi:MAG: hypothetical protein A2580_08690 [Hydrogenophilales bacterium RIFOXYD1_FULL_62_11]|nr:MAG: hypothetical protein A2580_08690 [Hydrogenophilales bacterium RIFOXYD1_FULL_62_11]
MDTDGQMKAAKPRHLAGRRGQEGYFLISALFALAIFGAMVMWGARLMDRHILVDRARSEGEAFGQFAVGLRGFVARAQSDATLIPGGAMTGVNWLKAPSCGGLGTNPEEGFVPCGYRGMTYGSLYSTTFTHNVVTNAIEARTTFRVPAQGDGPANSILLADHLVNTALAQQSLPNNGMFFTVLANVAPTATGPVPSTSPAFANPGANAGRVLMVVNNAPSNDIFLRTDGTNQMLANLNMGGASLANARDGRFTGTVQIDDGLVVTSGMSEFREGVTTPDINLTGIGKAATQGIYSAQVLAGATSYTVPKPDCSQVGNRPAIYASIQGTGSINNDGTYRGDAIYDSRVDVTDLGASWRVVPVVRGTRFELRDTGGGIELNKTLTSPYSPTDMRVVAMVRCQ